MQIFETRVYQLYNIHLLLFEKRESSKCIPHPIHTAHMLFGKIVKILLPSFHMIAKKIIKQQIENIETFLRLSI